MTARNAAPHGMAMLFVLSALVLSVTATVLIARTRTSARLNTLSDARLSRCEGLREESSDPILDWLQTRSADAVLPPDSAQPAVNVLNDRWKVSGDLWQLRITAWDQCGMVPLEAVIDEHPMGSELPQQFRDRVSSIEHFSEAWCGLDWFRDEHPSPFPEPESVTPSSFGDLGETNVEYSARAAVDELVALGGLISTHGPIRSGRERKASPIWLNINTAPMPVLRRALALAGISGADTIEQARNEGKRAALDLRASTRGGNQASTIRFVNSSPVWAFRIDAQVNGVRRSWWEIWSLEGGKWEAVQRLAIDQ